MTWITGFLSTPKSTDALMARMSEAFLEDTIIINDRYTMDEFNDYTEEGALGEGAHDDYVDALMIALFCGHEGEVIERREGARKEVPGATEPNRFRVLDRNGVVMHEGNDQRIAELASAKIVGSQIERTATATAELVRMSRASGEKKKVRIPADFQNTEFSPVYDKPGTAKKLNEEEGIPPEAITPEMIAEFEEQEEARENDPNSWMYQ